MIRRGYRRFLPLTRVAVFLIAGAAAVASGEPGTARPTDAEEFFIVSSIDAQKSAMVLKRPTEVTVTMLVGPRTSYRTEQGKAIQLSDLRAGDTVFIASTRGGSGALTASVVRKGIMTVPELKRRYLNGATTSP
jgi:3-dehydroquinate synthase class II